MAVSITYPGVSAPRSVRYTLTRGVMPDIAFLEMTSQASTIAANGDLVISDDGETITLGDCRVNTSSLRVSPDGQVMQVQLWDRRHWWQYRRITGRYNYMKPDGTRDSAGEKNMQELATLLLTAAGETGYDISALPNTEYPYVSWDNDTPMDELNELCQRYGYEVTWNPYTDTVTIVLENSGSDLPNNTDVRSFSFGVTAGKRPSSIVVLGARKVYQSRLKLVAVGREEDGSIKPINDLSYKPTGNWNWVQGSEFEDVRAEHGETAQRLAKETVFRWYMVESQADGTLDVPGYGEVTDIASILPIDSTINDTDTPTGGKQRYQRARINGSFLPGAGENAESENTSVIEPYEGDFRIIESIGLVIFGGEYPVVKKDGAGSLEPAELYLTCSYNVRDETTHQPLRYEKVTALSGAPTLSGAIVVRHPEIVQRFTAQYTDPVDPTLVTSVTENTTACDDEADLITTQTALSFGDSAGYVVSYRFLKAIALSGKVWQVGWNVRMRTDRNEGGSDTVAAQRMEFDPNILGHTERTRLVQHRRRRLRVDGPDEDREKIHLKRL